MKETDFVFNSVQLMYYQRHKVSFVPVGSYIDSPDWIKKKKATLKLKNKDDDTCFQYAATIASIDEKIEPHPQSIKPFINKYDREGMNYPSKIDDWKTFEKNNLINAFNILYTKEK